MERGSPHSREGGAAGRVVVYCLVPRELAAALHEPLREHFSADRSVEVIVEQRASDRRRRGERRVAGAAPARDVSAERRRINNRTGRRIGERRAPLVEACETPELPRKARRHADRLAFVECLEPSTQEREDLDTAWIVTRFQGGDRHAFADIYRRYFDRVYNYARFALRDSADAEDVTQRVFMGALEGLDRFEYRRRPFRAWLFVIARNSVATHLKRGSWTTPTDPHDIVRRRELDPDAAAERDPSDLDALGWISDRDLHVFIGRLPETQRQALVLKFMVGLGAPEIAEVMGISPDAARQQLSRAIGFLRARLGAVGRTPERPNRAGIRGLRPHLTVLRSRRFALVADSAR